MYLYSWLAKSECVKNWFHKASFSNKETNIDLPKNALKEINEECLKTNVDIEHFITLDKELETHQIYESVSYLVEELQNIEHDDNDDRDQQWAKYVIC